MTDFNGKVVVITGGTSGLGFAFAQVTGRQGAKVIITGRREELGAKAEAALKAENIEAAYVPQDTTVEESWDNLLKVVLGKYGRIDYAFNNVGVMCRPVPSMKLSMRDWDWVIDTNIRGTLIGLRKFTGALMMQAEGGSIITTASIASLAPFATWSPYSVTKAAVLRLVESFRDEMAMGGITKIKYSVAMPGVFESDLFNSYVYRNEQYKTPGVEDPRLPTSAAHTPDGDKLGMITAEECVVELLKQIDAGKFYVYPHEDLADALRGEVQKSMNNEQPPTDQAVFDFAFYAKNSRLRAWKPPPPRLSK